MKPFVKRYLLSLWKSSATLNNAILASYIDYGKNLKVLDLGCEDGTLILERIEDKIKNPKVYGIEIEPRLVKLAKKNGIFAVAGSADKHFPFSDNFFDVVSANQIIEHIVDVDTFTSEIFRVIKPGGYAVISTENLSSWHNLVALLMGWQAFSQHISRRLNVGNPFRLNAHNPVNLKTTSGMHIKIFTPRGLREIFELYGFKVEKTYGAGFYPFMGSISKILSGIDPTHSVFIGLKARRPKK